MKTIFSIAILLTCFSGNSQEIKNLDNVLIVALFNKPEDRYTMEIAIAELFANEGKKATPSLNILKAGASINLITLDSIQKLLKDKGITRILLVSVRGYDTKFKDAKTHNDLTNELNAGHSFPIYRDEATSVTFEFNLYESTTFVGYDQVKASSISSRDGVMKKFRRKMRKKLSKSWG